MLSGDRVLAPVYGCGGKLRGLARQGARPVYGWGSKLRGLAKTGGSPCVRVEKPYAGSLEDRVFPLCTGGEQAAGEADPSVAALLVSGSLSEFVEIIRSPHHETTCQKREAGPEGRAGPGGARSDFAV